MGARKFDDFDADEFKRKITDGYDAVVRRLRKERKRLNLKVSDMAEMLSVVGGTYREMEYGKHSIKNKYLKIMYDNGFDIEYIFTGKRSNVNFYKDRFNEFDDNEIENLLKNLCIFIKGFRRAYKSLKRICDEKEDVLYCIINKDGKRNVYEICRVYYNYTQEEMSVRSGYSLNMYKKVKNIHGVIRPDSKRIYTIYKGANIPPLMLIDDRASNISELAKLAAELEPEAIPELKKMNPTLYNVLFN